MKTFKYAFLLLFFALISVLPVSAQKVPMGAYGTIQWTAVHVLPPTSGSVATVLEVQGPTTATLSGASTLKLPSATVLCAGWPTVKASGTFFSWDWFVYNTSAGASTLTLQLADGDTSVSKLGTMTVAQNAIRHMRVSIKGCNTSAPKAVYYSLGSSTF